MLSERTNPCHKLGLVGWGELPWCLVSSEAKEYGGSLSKAQLGYPGNVASHICAMKQCPQQWPQAVQEGILLTGCIPSVPKPPTSDPKECGLVHKQLLDFIPKA